MKKLIAFLISLLFVASTFGIGTLMANRCGIVINEINTGEEDMVELYNYGPSQDMSNWRFYWQDQRGTSGNFRIPQGFVLGHNQFVILTEESGTNTATKLYFNSNIMWTEFESGGIAGALFDSTGKCIDYFRTEGSTYVPPPNSWSGPDMPYPVTNNVGYRNSDIDTDTGKDWSVGGTNTPLALNPGQTGQSSCNSKALPMAQILEILKANKDKE
ncbi:MAG: lamin tail domain-containing protein [SAR324 cluster bacterium]|uniref:Lamin tail domain-containing protein n=1 Tax=SAR324 cluster bacterium TaxID=2024889 RepID=A0A7X9FUS3_9DELT|nr:lamin tail domain-containing protein [SAR324 cluster bacterium]